MEFIVMADNCFRTGILSKSLIVLFLTLTVYNSAVHATGSPFGDDAEFMSEVIECLRHPDESDIYPDDPLSVANSAIQTQNTTPIPYNTDQNARDPGGHINSQGEIGNTPENDKTGLLPGVMQMA
ncbi:MAG: hypothetical protein JEZ12_15730 [Desulfobacterium sp.]|nr:hypothetical protein [Desulfobacterium sp.]